MRSAELDDVPDNQEIAREVEFFDEREFLLNLLVRPAAEAGGESIRIIAIALAYRDALAEERVHGLTGRNGIPGELIAEVGESELEAIGKFAGVGDGFGKVGEDARHLPGVFQVALGVDGEQAAGFVDLYFIADAGEDVECFAGFGSSVTHAVGGDEREVAMAAREIEQGLVVRFFVAVEMPLQFHVYVLCAEQIQDGSPAGLPGIPVPRRIRRTLRELPRLRLSWRASSCG